MINNCKLCESNLELEGYYLPTEDYSICKKCSSYRIVCNKQTHDVTEEQLWNGPLVLIFRNKKWQVWSTHLTGEPVRVIADDVPIKELCHQTAVQWHKKLKGLLVFQ